jgi:(2R)-ethylmalonyl-CoA mutase
VLRLLREGGGADIPVVVGGVIPQSDADQLRSFGVAAVFTPKDYDATEIIDQIVDVIRARTDLTT